MLIIPLAFYLMVQPVFYSPVYYMEDIKGNVLATCNVNYSSGDVSDCILKDNHTITELVQVSLTLRGQITKQDYIIYCFFHRRKCEVK